MQLDINLFMGSHVRVVLQEGWFGSIYEEARTDCRKGGSEQSMRGLGRVAGRVVYKIYEKARTGCRKGGSEQSMRGLGRIAGRVVRNNL